MKERRSADGLAALFRSLFGCRPRHPHARLIKSEGLVASRFGYERLPRMKVVRPRLRFSAAFPPEIFTFLTKGFAQCLLLVLWPQWFSGV